METQKVKVLRANQKNAKLRFRSYSSGRGVAGFLEPVRTKMKCGDPYTITYTHLYICIYIYIYVHMATPPPKICTLSVPLSDSYHDVSQNTRIWVQKRSKVEVAMNEQKRDYLCGWKGCVINICTVQPVQYNMFRIPRVLEGCTVFLL